MRAPSAGAVIDGAPGAAVSFVVLRESVPVPVTFICDAVTAIVAESPKPLALTAIEKVPPAVHGVVDITVPTATVTVPALVVQVPATVYALAVAAVIGGGVVSVTVGTLAMVNDRFAAAGLVLFARSRCVAEMVRIEGP